MLKCLWSLLTTVSDHPFCGVSFSEAGDGGETDKVGLRLDQLGQVVGDQLSLLDGSLHGDLLLPPSRLTGLVERHRDRQRQTQRERERYGES